MTRASASAALAALGLFALGGCGTVSNLYYGGPDELPEARSYRVYGGTRLDLEEAGKLFDPPPPAPKGQPDNSSRLVLKACLHALDLPLSLVADTATLPLTTAAAVDEFLEPGPDFVSATGQAPGNGVPAPPK